MQSLNLLLLEDSAEDAELASLQLRREGYEVTARRVDTVAGLHDALEAGDWDIVLSDHNIPGFDPLEAYSIIHAAHADLPVIVLSGTIGEEATVEALRSGARDVVLKSNLGRLGLVVGRVLEDAALRRQRREAEARLVESSTRMAAILDSALDCIISIDHLGRIIDFNPAAEATFGYTRQDAYEKQMADLIIPPSLRGSHLARFERHLATGESTIIGTRLELTGMRADGSEFPLELAITRSEVSGVPFFTAYLRDNTALKRAEEEQRLLEEQLRQSQKMEAIGNLAGGVAHDFNNLLTVIRGTSSIMLSGKPEGKLLEQIQQIDAAAARAAELTGQLLAYSRQQMLRPVTTDLNAVLGETLMLLERLIGEDVSVEVQLAPAPAIIVVDRGQLSQVILNLAINARDAMPDGGTLTMKTDHVELDEASAAEHHGLSHGRYVRLKVGDTGIGMDEETQSHIFDPFYTTKTEGTGLGLSTVHGIVAQSNGHLLVDSRPGAGTRITLHFPAATGPITAEPSQVDVDTLEGTETILVVEDTDILLKLVAEILESYGYKVITAASGAEALAIAASEQVAIDLLLTDVVMPGMNGRELADRLRTSRPLLKVMFTSGYPANAIDAQTQSVAFIQKPYVAAELAHEIRTVLDAPT